MSIVAEQVDPMEVEEFLRLLQGNPGTWEGNDLQGMSPPLGELTAAAAVGWTPRKLKTLKSDPDFLILMAEARNRFIESIETVVARQAFRGSRWANEMILFCQASDRGWRPPTQRHEVQHGGAIDVAAKAAVLESVRATLGRTSVRELQEAGKIIDAEVVDDGPNG